MDRDLFYHRSMSNKKYPITLQEAAKKLGTSKQVIHARIKSGYSFKEAISENFKGKHSSGRKAKYKFKGKLITLQKIGDKLGMSPERIFGYIQRKDQLIRKHEKMREVIEILKHVS